MTVLEIVNQVLRRLREDTVTNITDTTQAQLIHEFVKDSVVMVQSMHNWSMLKSTVQITTAASDYDYTLTGAGKKFKVLNVWNDTEECFMDQKDVAFFQQHLNITNATNEKPSFYGFDTHDASGDPTVFLWPIPNAVYTIDFNLIIPQSRDDLTEATEVKIPETGVVMMAWAMAIEERGEDAGAVGAMTMQKALQYVGNDIAEDWERTGLNQDFHVE